MRTYRLTSGKSFSSLKRGYTAGVDYSEAEVGNLVNSVDANGNPFFTEAPAPEEKVDDVGLFADAGVLVEGAEVETPPAAPAAAPAHVLAAAHEGKKTVTVGKREHKSGTV